MEPFNHLLSTYPLSTTYYVPADLLSMYQYLSIIYMYIYYIPSFYLSMDLSSTCPCSIIYQSISHISIIYLYLSICLLTYVSTLYLAVCCLSSCLSISLSVQLCLSIVVSICLYLSVCLWSVCLSVSQSMHHLLRLTHFWSTRTKPCLSDFHGHSHPNTTWPLDKTCVFISGLFPKPEAGA